MKLIQYLRKLVHIEYVVNQESKKLLYVIKRDQMAQYAINSTTMGTTTDAIHDGEVVVSLTSYGNRLMHVALTIESIMQGTMKPNRIVLAISEDYRKEELPILLQKQQKRGLEILFCKDILSYKKIIPTLQKYPDSYIITIDDDCIYNQDLVENLVRGSKQHPEEICANRVHRISFGSNGKIMPYLNWTWESKIEDATFLNFFTGVGGVIYPPHSLANEVTDEDTFFTICKYADDIWLHAMAVKQGTPIRKLHTYDANSQEYIGNPDINDGLHDRNLGHNANDVQFKAVYEKFNLYDKLRS